MMKEGIQEVQMDDDVETDDEVLASGVHTCYEDLRQLKDEIRKRGHFRAHSHVVNIWRPRGFWFDRTAQKNQCTNNFECGNIFS